MYRWDVLIHGQGIHISELNEFHRRTSRKALTGSRGEGRRLSPPCLAQLYRSSPAGSEESFMACQMGQPLQDFSDEGGQRI
jgi:hypothetical protein